ncbi:hypothetical protein K439DRAFT_1641854 [Ramaria rubella]|nr:hypothetical protein K439DRAFT_1641854 [Ramaria rubella]
MPVDIIVAVAFSTGHTKRPSPSSSSSPSSPTSIRSCRPSRPYPRYPRQVPQDHFTHSSLATAGGFAGSSSACMPSLPLRDPLEHTWSGQLEQRGAR